MSFNSLEFWFFFGVVFSLYVSLRRERQNLLLLAASYIFYFSIARAFVLLLLLTTCLDFYCALAIGREASPGRRRAFLVFSLAGNFAVLVLFKYFPIFGAHGFWASVAPVGLSFYILQSVSYVVDVYRGERPPHRNFREYALYIAFFPQLLAGPIERASQMLPQIQQDRAVTGEGVRRGLWLCFWGLVEKSVISDNIQDRILNHYLPITNGLAMSIVLWAACIRVYCDFDGYSNIARGLASLLGFQLAPNFNLPTIAVSAQDLWRRFHITFFRWIKDYIFRPLRSGLGVPAAPALLLAFLFSGLWHQLSLPFLVWGLYQGSILLLSEVPAVVIRPIYQAATGLPRLAMRAAGMLATKFLMGIGVAFFISGSVPAALSLLKPVFTLGSWQFTNEVAQIFLLYFFFNLPRYCTELPQILRGNLLAPLQISPAWRAGLGFLLLLYLVLYGVTSAEKFVYFQF